jgi:PAS domain S-box-containing protein
MLSKESKKMIRFLFIVVLFTMLSGTALATPNVLVVHSYHRNYEWTASVGQAMERVLRKDLPEAELFIEEMDSKRHPPEIIFPIFKRYLAAKYANQRFDVILCSDDNALDFLLSFRDELFPGVPVVFCGINDFQNDRLAGRVGFTGVAEETDLKGNLGLILKLHPDTRQVAVISDTTPSGHADLQRFKKIAPLFANRLRFLHLSELSASQLEKSLAELPPRTVVLLLDYFRDGEGRYFTVKHGNRLICRNSKAPVYSAWSFRVKEGLVGGLVVSGRQQGQTAAGMALRILRGENPAAIAVLRQSPNEYLFDYPALARFKISPASLPEGSRILKRPQTFYPLSKRQLVTALVAMSLITLALLTNIVLRRHAEKALRNRQARLKAIHDNAAAGIALADKEGRYVEVNDKWAEMFGCSPQDIVGQNFLDLTFADDRDENSREIHALLQGGKDHCRIQKRFTRKDGTIFWVDNSVTRIVNEQGQVEALVGIIIDITEQKLIEERLQETNRELDAFVSTASHDLRSPLAIIIGFAELLRKEYSHQFDERKTEFLNHIEQCAHKMHQLLEDLLAFAQVGYVEKPRQAVDADQVAREVALAQSQKAEGIVIERGILPSIHIPRSFLIQIFDNLIGNGVRYAGCAGGAIEVGGEAQDDRVRFYVRDHGPGIAPEERERIFDPFFRGAAGENIPGTGIGLATVQKIARLYGGSAWLEDTPGGGCTFWVEMQNIRPEPSETSSSPDSSPEANGFPLSSPGNCRVAPSRDRSVS